MSRASLATLLMWLCLCVLAAVDWEMSGLERVFGLAIARAPKALSLAKGYSADPRAPAAPAPVPPSPVPVSHGCSDEFDQQWGLGYCRKRADYCKGHEIFRNKVSKP